MVLAQKYVYTIASAMLETQMLKNTEGTEISKTLGMAFNLYDGQLSPLHMIISAFIRQLHLFCHNVE